MSERLPDHDGFLDGRCMRSRCFRFHSRLGACGGGEMPNRRSSTDSERLDWLDNGDNVTEFIAALTIELPPAAKAELLRRNVNLKSCSVRDLIDVLKTMRSK